MYYKVKHRANYTYLLRIHAMKNSYIYNHLEEGNGNTSYLYNMNIHTFHVI